MFEREPDEPGARRQFARRIVLLGLGQIGIFAALDARLYQLQITDGNKYARLAEENRISVEILAPDRGRILDRWGRVLAGNVDSYRAVIVPAAARDLRGVLGRFTAIEPLSKAEIDHILQRARRQSPSTAIVLAVDLPWERLAAINLDAPSLPGVRTERAGRRQYAASKALGPVLGYTGAVSRRAMDDTPELRLPGLRVGRAGVELGLDEALRGRSGSVTSEVDARGRVVRIIDQVDPKPGRDVTLTIDSDLQDAVYEKLGQHRRASAVVVAVGSGEIVAMASLPGFDANLASGAVDAAEFARLQKSPDEPLENRAIRGLYPPGSTFKLVTALAALEGGHVGLEEKIECSGAYQYFGHTYHCWRHDGHGSCDLHRALTESCDCYFYELARRTGIEAIAQMARLLDLGIAPDAGIAQAKSGLIPDHDWKRGRFLRNWLGGETILAGIGQGYVLATPLQLAGMVARVASGRLLKPTLIARAAGEPAPPPLPVAQQSLLAVRRGMAAVVNDDGGTGAKAQGESGAYLMAGKTGTSQTGRSSRGSPQSELAWKRRDHALFVGFAPLAAPRYAIATVVDHGGGGGAVAAPLARSIMDIVMERDPVGRRSPPSASADVTPGRDG